MYDSASPVSGIGNSSFPKSSPLDEGHGSWKSPDDESTLKAVMSALNTHGTFYSVTSNRSGSEASPVTAASPLAFSRAGSLSNIQFLRSRTNSSSPQMEAARERKREVLNSLQEKLKNDETEKSEEHNQRHSSPKDRFQSLVKTVISENPQIKSLKIALEARDEEILKLKKTEEAARIEILTRKKSQVDFEHDNSSKSREIESITHELETLKSMHKSYQAAIEKLRRTNDSIIKSRLDVLTQSAEGPKRNLLVEFDREIRHVLGLFHHSEGLRIKSEMKYRAIQKESELEKENHQREKLLWEQRERQLRAQIILQADVKATAETSAAEAIASLSQAKTQMTAISAQYMALKDSYNELLLSVEEHHKTTTRNHRSQSAMAKASNTNYVVSLSSGGGGDSPLPKRTWYPSGIPNTNYHDPKEPISVLRECACCPNGRHVLSTDLGKVPVYTQSTVTDTRKVRRAPSPPTTVTLAPTSSAASRYYKDDDDFAASVGGNDYTMAAAPPRSASVSQHTIVISAAPREVTPVRVRQRHPLRSDSGFVPNPRSSSVTSRSSAAGGGANFAVVLKAPQHYGGGGSRSQQHVNGSTNEVNLIAMPHHGLVPISVSALATTKSAPHHRSGTEKATYTSNNAAERTADRRSGQLADKISDAWNRSFNPPPTIGRFTTAVKSPSRAHLVQSEHRSTPPRGVPTGSSLESTQSTKLRDIPPLTSTQVPQRVITGGGSPFRMSRPDDVGAHNNRFNLSPRRSPAPKAYPGLAPSPSPLLNRQVPVLQPSSPSPFQQQKVANLNSGQETPSRRLEQVSTAELIPQPPVRSDSASARETTSPNGRSSTPKRHFASTDAARKLQTMLESELAEFGM